MELDHIQVAVVGVVSLSDTEQIQRPIIHAFLPERRKLAFGLIVCLQLNQTAVDGQARTPIPAGLTVARQSCADKSCLTQRLQLPEVREGLHAQGRLAGAGPGAGTLCHISSHPWSQNWTD